MESCRTGFYSRKEGQEVLVRSTESTEELSDQKTEQMGEPENQMGG